MKIQLIVICQVKFAYLGDVRPKNDSWRRDRCKLGFLRKIIIE